MSRIDSGMQPIALKTLLRDALGGAFDALPTSLEVTGLALDSRSVESGYLFIALPGNQSHGLSYLPQALERGAAALLYDPQGLGPQDLLAIELAPVPVIEQTDLAAQVGWIAARFFQSPSESLEVVGVTGTNGKTSCSYYIAQALLHMQHVCGVIGTLGWGLPEQLQDTSHTTPDALQLQGCLRALLHQGAKAVAMEASSHGLAQGRTQGIHFAGALYTNVTRDHLDYHGSMSAYLNAKLSLLKAPGLRFVVFNLADAHAAAILAAVPVGVRILGFSREPVNNSAIPDGMECIRLVSVQHSRATMTLNLAYQAQQATLQTSLRGDFNFDNLLATVAVLVGLGHVFARAVQAASDLKPVAGRMEMIVNETSAPQVLVDYAHTPAALETVLKSLRQGLQGHLWVVFGCGGERDSGKRPQMGQVAELWADRIVLTDDNPRGEHGDEIVQDIVSGCSSAASLQVIRDRAAAIRTAIEQAMPEDIVLIAGKGHEASQDIQGVRYPFSDRQVAQQALEGRGMTSRAAV